MIWYLTIHFEENYKRFLDSIWKIKPQNSKLYSFLRSPIIPYLRLSVTVLRISISSLNTSTVLRVLSVRTHFWSSLLSIRKIIQINLSAVAGKHVFDVHAERLWSKVELRQVHTFTPYQPSAVASGNKVW